MGSWRSQRRFTCSSKCIAPWQVTLTCSSDSAGMFGKAELLQERSNLLIHGCSLCLQPGHLCAALRASIALFSV